MAHKKEPQVAFARFKLLLHVFWQWRLVTEEGLVVKSVVNRCNLLTRPSLKLVGKSLAGRDCAVGPVDRLPSEDSLDARIE